MIETIADSTDPVDQEILALTLPDFVTLRPARQPISLRYLPEKKVVVADEMPGIEFETPTEAYDAIPHEYVEFFLDDSLKHFGDLLSWGVLLSKADSRIIVATTSLDIEYFLKADYRDFLEAAEQYRADPKNWVLAYRFVEMHPAFWYIRTDDPYHWHTREGFQDHAWISVDMLNGKPNVAFEHGPHVLPECAMFYSEPKLTLRAPSLEKAYVKLAERLDQYYELDGSDKEKEMIETKQVTLP